MIIHIQDIDKSKFKIKGGKATGLRGQRKGVSHANFIVSVQNRVHQIWCDRITASEKR